MAEVITRKRSLTPDENGNYRAYVGWREPGKQQRFNFGKDLTEAEWRYAAVQRLYNDDCRDSGQNLWSLRGLAYAKEIEAGKKVIEFPAPPAEDRGAVVEYQQGINLIQKWFPSLSIVPADSTVFSESSKQNDNLVASRIEEHRALLHEIGALRDKDDIPDRLIPGTFHEVLTAYSNVIERDGEPNDSISRSSSGGRAVSMRLRFWRVYFLPRFVTKTEVGTWK